LLSKRRRDWPRCAEDNRRALALGDGSPDDPAAWNLGIALTALGDWSGAAQAWSAYGLDVPSLLVSSVPLALRLGLTPVRLNPEPRHLGETPLRLEGKEHSTEVVWCQRLCPARARIENVPTPASGHSFGDVVLHDGEPVGERQSGEHRYPVFNELALLERSGLPTLHVVVTCPEASHLDELLTVFHDRDLGAEDHGNVQLLCRACSEGSPDHDAHTHDRPAEGTMGVALGAPRDTAYELLSAWAAAAPGRVFGDLDRVL